MNPVEHATAEDSIRNWILSLSLAGTAPNLGARGYVVKSDAAKDLLRAMEVVMGNKQFVSKCVVGYESS
jgi:DNA-binding NarL/FixJ family response regulator